MRKILTLLAALGIVATACSSDDPTGQGDGPDRRDDQVVLEVDGTEVVLTSSLSGFDSCDALLDHLRTEGAERVGPYGFNEGWYGPWPVDVALAEGDLALDEEGGFDGGAVRAPAEEPQAAELVEGVDFSGTNVQETGVDEADLVKTDGERVYIVANSELVVVDVASRAVVGSVDPTSEQRRVVGAHVLDALDRDDRLRRPMVAQGSVRRGGAGRGVHDATILAASSDPFRS